MIITDFCTGCRACEQLCPTHCIYVEPDEEGFIVAKIDENACVECGVCVKRCPQNNPPEKMFQFASLVLDIRIMMC
ncbi:indolepyruvate ferredoxin oxidoreductase subunit alpha [Bacteroides sp.]|uniref:indolepyruvate ferredoxin oxidoreductase subunit alpha n=1 Tax=Bacteroides sp. TaxID=29523 RepID=UPI0039C08524